MLDISYPPFFLGSTLRLLISNREDCLSTLLPILAPAVPYSASTIKLSLEKICSIMATFLFLSKEPSTDSVQPIFVIHVAIFLTLQNQTNIVGEFLFSHSYCLAIVTVQPQLLFINKNLQSIFIFFCLFCVQQQLQELYSTDGPDGHDGPDVVMTPLIIQFIVNLVEIFYNSAVIHKILREKGDISLERQVGMGNLCIVISRERYVSWSLKWFRQKKGRILCRKSPTNCLKYIICALNYDFHLYFSAAGGENRNCQYKYKVEEED